MKHVKNVILTHKAYVGVIIVMAFLLLVRIPLGTFNESSLLDTVGHFIVSAAGAPLLAVFIQEAGVLRGSGRASFIFLASLLGITAEALWEIFEYGVDVLFHLQWQPSNADTMTDIILTVIGTFVGSLLFVMLYQSPKLTNKS